MQEKHPRHIPFEAIPNFRDIGGYRTRDGRTVVWRRIYRSGALHRMTRNDVSGLKEILGLLTAVDLRSPSHIQQKQEMSLLKSIGANYYNMPFRPDNPRYFEEEMKLYRITENLGEIYLARIRDNTLGKRLVATLEIITNQENHPLVFHCGAGKDRTGILAAIILDVLGVPDEDIVEDYALTDPFMEGIRDHWLSDPEIPEEVKRLPDFVWRAVPESMKLFLSLVRHEYGSVRGYLEKMGAEPYIFDRLKAVLLV